VVCDMRGHVCGMRHEMRCASPALCVRHASHATSHAKCVRMRCDECAHGMRCVCASTPRSILSSFVLHLASSLSFILHLWCFVMFGVSSLVFAVAIGCLAFHPHVTHVWHFIQTLEACQRHMYMDAACICGTCICGTSIWRVCRTGPFSSSKPVA